MEEENLKAKLSAVKSELQVKTGHWRNEWQQTLAKWIDEVYILSPGDFIILPKDPYSKRTFFIKAYSDNNANDGNDGNSTGLSSADHIKDLDSALSYGESYGCLNSIPVNLKIPIFRYLVNAFNNGNHGDGCFSTELSGSRYRDYFWFPHFWLDDENKRHHELIRRLFETTSRTNANTEPLDNWQSVPPMRLLDLSDEKMQVEYYIEPLLEKLKLHQVNRMIEHHFQFHWKRKEVMDAAKKFAEKLIAPPSMEYKLQIGLILPTEIFYLFKATPAEFAQGREAMKTLDPKGKRWNGFDRTNLATPLNEFGYPNLTTEDAHFIICCRIDAEYDARESREAIEKITSSNSAGVNDSFPTANDDFSNFDFPHLRGLLSQTFLSRKLQSHHLGLEAIRRVNTGSFAAIVPAALVNIVAEYLPVSL